METIRILHCVIGNMNVGGIETMLMEIYRNINRDKFQFDFVVHDKKESYFEKEIEKLGGIVYRIPFLSKKPLQHCIEFYELLKKHAEYHIVHIHTTYSIMYFDAKIAEQLGRIVVVHSHNSGASKKRTRMHRLFKRKLSEIADYRLACSNIAAEWMFEPEHLKSVKIWKNAVNIEKFRFDNQKRILFRKQNGGEGKFILGTVGRLSYQKNQKLLLYIFAEVLKKHIDALLWIIGDGEERSALERQSKELQIQDRVIFWGIKNNIPDYLMALDAFILTSRWEGFGMAIVEAQAVGLPIVIPSCTDNLVRITSGVKVVNVYEDSEQWVDYIIEIWKEREVTLNRRKKCFDMVNSAGFKIETQIEVVQQFYSEIYNDKNTF